MRRLAPVIVLLATAGSVAAETPPPWRGIAVGLHSKVEAWSYRPQLEEALALGANAVSLLVPLRMRDVRSSTVEGMGVEAPALAAVAAEARAMKLDVFLIPYIQLDVITDDEWRGTLAPGDWEAWWASYTRMVLELARFAARHDVALFAVGSELCSAERFTSRWLALIGQVREVYSGTLTYSANWDHLEPVGFVGALDVVGMNAYFELGRSEEASLEELLDAWHKLRPAIRRWVDAQRKPLVFTEVGYPSRAGGARWPWDYTREAEVDTAIQATAYEAFLSSWWRDPRVEGVFFYELWGEGGPSDPGYTPRGKPAAESLRRHYRERAESDTAR